ncbi:hypothetical protein AGMMS4952_25270 [Spirochaetia bacterium]|nr:hypothetical protein AGMMS4952_25270 [Spirochaetia bacterium]
MRVRVSFGYSQAWVLSLTLAAFLLLGACNRAPEVLPLTPPATPPLSRAVIGYGVVSSSYTHVQNDPAPESVSLGYLRRGAMVEILERKKSWIRVNGAYRGWIKEDGVLFYGTKAQAMTASDSLSSGPEGR